MFGSQELQVKIECMTDKIDFYVIEILMWNFCKYNKELFVMSNILNRFNNVTLENWIYLLWWLRRK